MLQTEQSESLAKYFPGLKYCGEHHNDATRSKTQKLFGISNNKTGTKLAKYKCIKEKVLLEKV